MTLLAEVGVGTNEAEIEWFGPPIQLSPTPAIARDRIVTDVVVERF